VAEIEDVDRFFSGQLNASTPRHLIGEGEAIRLINARFVEGAITNAVGFDELPVKYRDDKNFFASPLSYQEILETGDVQLVAPLENTSGKFLIAVISGRLFKIDLSNNIATDITFASASLPENSNIYPLSYIDNNGAVYGVGGYLVIFNGFNRPIFISAEDARSSREDSYEMPPSWMGATAGSRAFVIARPNILNISDPLGGSSSLAPLTFDESLNPSGTYYGQVFTIGSALESDPVTAVCRLPSYGTGVEEFLARSILISTSQKKYIVSAGSARATWDSPGSNFIYYAGLSDGISGPLAWTNIGELLFYVSSTGRLKTLGQDAERDQGLQESFMDESLGQYLCPLESNFFYRDWYRTLDHSRSIAKYHMDRLYVTVYPIKVPARSVYGKKHLSPSHRALAVGSIDSTTRLGPTATIAWEGFYDWLNPIGIVTVGSDLYVVSKDVYGRVRFYKENFQKSDDHTSTIYTRGYFSAIAGKARSMLVVELFFRRLFGEVKITISYLVNDKWVKGSVCTTNSKYVRTTLEKRCKTSSYSIPLKIDIEHKGCRFELESVRANGETHSETR
jgi:hypothetical protein